MLISSCMYIHAFVRVRVRVRVISRATKQNGALNL